MNHRCFRSHTHMHTHFSRTTIASAFIPIFVQMCISMLRTRCVGSTCSSAKLNALHILYYVVCGMCRVLPVLVICSHARYVCKEHTHTLTHADVHEHEHTQTLHSLHIIFLRRGDDMRAHQNRTRRARAKTFGPREVTTRAAVKYLFSVARVCVCVCVLSRSEKRTSPFSGFVGSTHISKMMM